MLGERLPQRLSPLASRLGFRAYYGDIHNHCDLSYGHGRFEDALIRARRQLDFVSVTLHAFWPDMPVDDPRVAHIVDFHVKGFAKLEKTWPDHFRQIEAFDDPGSFTVFPGYEIHSFAHGDYTIVYRDLDQRQLIEADTPGCLHQRLQSAYGSRAIAFPHHIGYRLGARGINWGSFNEDLSPILEIVSMHGCSETSMMDRPFLHSMGPSDGHSTARHGLDQGYIFGFLGNTDHHSAYPGSYGHGRSAVYAAENDRTALWDAVGQRRTNALTGDNTHLFTAIGDTAQGGTVSSSSNAKLDIEAVGGSFIDFIDVIRSGRIVSRVTPDLHQSPIAVDTDGMIETIFVIELGWGARGTVHDWKGSISLSGGEILAVEPRLRGAEIVSPLEGSDLARDRDSVELDGNVIDFEIQSSANPNNSTVATQAIAARVRISPDSTFHAVFNGKAVDVSASRLLESALSGNLGPIDSPAYRFHPLPLPHQWQWRGHVDLNDLKSGEWLYVRMRQSNGQWSWASPIFCR